MQHRPDIETLLTAVARFLEQDVKPYLTDPAVSYRALVAVSLLKTVRAECAGLQRDGGGFGEEGDSMENRLYLREFLEAVRAGDVSETEQREARAHMKELLKTRLKRTTPHFDVSDAVE